VQTSTALLTTQYYTVHVLCQPCGSLWTTGSADPIPVQLADSCPAPSLLCVCVCNCILHISYLFTFIYHIIFTSILLPLGTVWWPSPMLQRPCCQHGVGEGPASGSGAQLRLAMHADACRSTGLAVTLPGCKPLFLAALYVPRASSTAAWSLGCSWQDMMTELQADVVAFSRQGDIAFMGDVNGHTGGIDDGGVESDAVLDYMGVIGGPRGQAPGQAIPLRASRATMRPCAVGRRLVDLCVATGCVGYDGL